MNSKGLNAMSALLNFLVPLSIFLSASNANAANEAELDELDGADSQMHPQVSAQ